MKKDGILLHITSLPSDYGIGDFGPRACQFADFLQENSYHYWQILPLYQTGYGNSPYNPLSAFALNPHLISPELLYQDGLIDAPDLEEASLPASPQVPYETVFKLKERLISKVADNCLSKDELHSFIEENALYIKPYLAYLTLCKLYGSNDWHLFREEHRSYSEALFEELAGKFKQQMLTIACAQMIARDHLTRLKEYVNSKGVRLIGDMPLYLSYHSSEVWANQDLFDLDTRGNRLHVAGVPPDLFTSEGQLWGNPVYRWDKLSENNYKLFIDRLKHALSYLDKLRLDHFIGYVNYWSVPCPVDPETGEPELPASALEGEWVKARPEEFFPRLRQEFPPESFIAEDLGVLNEEVCRHRDESGYPGMIILQFCFDDGIPKLSEFPPDRFLYTGTHDNATIREWFENLEPDSAARKNLMDYIEQNQAMFAGLALEDPEDVDRLIHKIMVIIARNSACETRIIPAQDIMGLDSSARMNIPGTALGNWQWRLEDFEELFQAASEKTETPS